MTNISKKLLNTKTEAKLFSQLAKLFTAADQNKIAGLFDDLFTDAERIMFAKRLAIVLMIHKGQSKYRIARLLNVSDTTVSRIYDQYNTGKFDHIVGITKKQEFDSEQFWKTLEVLLRLGMPSYGKDRWKGFGYH